MNKFTAMVLLGLASSLSHTAAAEPFNDRGPDWWQQPVSPREQVMARQDTPPSFPRLGFNDSGGDWVAAIVPHNDSVPYRVNQLAERSIGFNDKSDVGVESGAADNQTVAVFAATPIKPHS